MIALINDCVNNNCTILINDFYIACIALIMIMTTGTLFYSFAIYCVHKENDGI